MNHTTEHTTNATWSVLRKPDSPAFSLVYGYGYVANNSQHDSQAVADGWEVLATGLQPEIAVRMRDIYKAAGKVETATPDLSDILSYDFTEPVEMRDNSVCEEFDLVYSPVDGECSMWVEATVTAFDEDYVELDGFILVDRAVFLKHATLIAKADDDCGFVTEYADYCETLDKNWERVYAVAIATQTTTYNGNAA